MRRVGLIVLLILSAFTYAQTAQSSAAGAKPRITLDEFFNFVQYTQAVIAPDGNAVVIGTERGDWKHNRFRKDLWLWRDGGTGLTLLTSSGHDEGAQWSPDGKWIAFLSDRPLVEKDVEDETEQQVPAEEKPTPKPKPEPKGRAGEADDESKPVAHVYVISLAGGEAIPVTRGMEEVHALAWAPDSKSIYFATRTPWSKARRDTYKREWKDTVRYREQERGDVIARISMADAIARQAALGGEEAKPKSKEQRKEEETAETPGSIVVTTTPWRVHQLAVSPDGSKLAFNTDSVSQRVEGVKAYEIYLADANGGPAKQLTNNQAIEQDLRWTPDGKELAFYVQMGSAEGNYEEVQPRVYSVNAATGAVRRWGANFRGAITDWGLGPDGSLITAGRVGTEVQMYSAKEGSADLWKVDGWPGTYERVSTARRSPKVAVVYSSLERPTEVYIAESVTRLADAKPITDLNKLFTQRALPEGRPYQWKTDDRTLEGELIYPPGKFGARHLKTFVLIHGGPADADGNKFGADWYDWAILAASNDWLVFRPNYRGSSGYGDNFMREIVPNIVSRPGKDILDGIDALVKDGIADPNQVSIGGYSYGGYMTNWLITQRQFKAAVTGAGAVEHAANWGNDDLTFDDAWYLGGVPWTAEKIYNQEAALWQLNKVKTPTHMVAGADDIRVSVMENYLLERALHALNIPSSLLVFPGEGHPLANNPWHGKIKVREELNWLKKYNDEAKPVAE
jgi:dipeptidyl aminopeptidase/acylaminoacyl peptidase